MSKFNTLESFSPLGLQYAALFSSCYPGNNLYAINRVMDPNQKFNLKHTQLIRHMQTQVECMPGEVDRFGVPNPEEVEEAPEVVTGGILIREISKTLIAGLGFDESKFERDLGGDIESDPEALLPFESKNNFVVAWSGGLDSLCAVLHAVMVRQVENIILVHVNYNGPYADKESERAETTFRNLTCLLNEIITKYEDAIALRQISFMEVKTATRPMDASLLPLGYIMPGRNGFIATTVLDLMKSLGLLEHISHMYMTGHYRSWQGQYTGAVDKNYHFFGELSNLYFRGSPLVIQISSPFLSMTKEEMLAETLAYLTQLTSPNSVAENLFYSCVDSTVSCYDPKLKRCGRCSSCYKRWKAVSAALPNYHEEYSADISNPEINKEFASREELKGRFEPL